MSGDAMGHVVRHSPYKGVTYAVHLCIADSMNDMHLNQFWMAVANLALKARCSRRAAGQALDELVKDGWLTVLTPPFSEDGKPTGKPGKYQFEFLDVPVVFENRRAQPVRTPGAQPVLTGAQPGNTGCEATAHNPNKPKGQVRDPDCPKCDGTGLLENEVTCECFLRATGHLTEPTSGVTNLDDWNQRRKDLV